MPDNGTSAVAAAADWTPQEKFVWQRVAAGEIADFNKADGYGGYLDPKKPEGWPEKRVLRSAFLEAILLKDPYRGNLTRLGVNIFGARFTEAIDLEGAGLEHRLGLRGSLIEKGVDLSRLRSKYPISLSGSKVAGTLLADGLDLDANLFMRDGEFAEVDLRSAHIGGQVGLDGAEVTGKLIMNGLHVERSLFMRTKAKFAEVELTCAHIGGELNLTESKVTAKLKMNGLRVEQELLMAGKAEFADVDLTEARIGGQLSLADSKVNGTLDCDSVDVGTTVFLSAGATFSDSINLIFAKIGQNLELAGGAFSSQVDMTGARIGGEFRLGSARHSPAIWQTAAALILRNASVDTIQDLSNAWPARLDLNGFTYKSLGGFATEQDPMLERPVEWFEAWLGKQDRYAAQPYERLASCLKNHGKSEMATAIRYAGSERERKESSGRLRKIWLTIFKYSVGYGYRPWRALGWAAAFVLLGAAVLHISGEGLRNNMPYGFAYSFDMLLPIVKLREWHYKVDLEGWARYYFYGHKIMGYLLASFLIAGLSGLRAGSVSRE
jgi:hypothetical protein